MQLLTTKFETQSPNNTNNKPTKKIIDHTEKGFNICKGKALLKN